jgi:hypothetical protein
MNRLLQLLSGWQQGQCLPELWRALESPGEPPLGLVAADLLAHLAVPRSPVEALGKLVARGAFDAAEYLLSALDFGGTEVNEWLHQLEVERSLARTSMEEQLDNLLAQCGGGSCPVADLRTRREEIVNLAASDWEAAESRYQDLADEVQHWEDEVRGELLAELEKRRGELGDDPRVAAWRRRVERAVAAGHFDLARESLLGGPSKDLGRVWPPLPPPPPWDFGHASPREVCSWLRPGGEARVEFFSSWAPPPGDDAAGELVESLDALLSPGAAETEVRRFLASLERALGVPPQAAPPVERTAAGFRSVVRGLYHPAMPAFNPMRYPDGVPIALVAGESPSAPAAAAHERPPEAPLVFTDAQLPLAAGLAEIRPEDLFRLLPDPGYRQWHLLRFIGSQIKLDEALGPEVLQPHGELVFAREAESAALRSGDHCLCGVPGVGKTTLLKRLLLDLGNDGWRTALFDGGELEVLLKGGGASVSAADRRARLLAAATARATAPGGREGGALAVGIDRADELSAGTLELLARCERPPRLILAGWPDLRRRLLEIPGHSVSCYELKPLAFEAIRRFAEEVLDLHGLSWSEEDVLDRIAHAACGRPAVLLLLLRELFSQHERDGRTRRHAITNHYLDNALRGDGFRDSAAAVLFAPVQRDAGLKCVLAACLLEAQESQGSDPGIAGSDVNLWLSLLGLDFGEPVVADGLERLRELGIVERRERSGHLYLARGTMGLLVHHFLDRPMAYLEAERHQRELPGG